MPKYLKYYQEEEELWPQWAASTCTEEEVVVGIKKLEEHFIPLSFLCPIQVVFKNGAWSYGSRWKIAISRETLNWLTVAHEFAHAWLDHLRIQGKEKPGRHHCRQHRKLTTEALNYISSNILKEKTMGKFADGCLAGLWAILAITSLISGKYWEAA